jgi:repressor LexA
MTDPTATPTDPIAGTDEATAAFGRVVRERRLELGLSLATVAERVSCARSYLSAIETGRRPAPSEEVLGRLELALSLESGTLRRHAEWSRTPPEIRADLARMRAKLSASNQLAALLASGEGCSLDELYRSGELGRLVDLIRPESPGPGEPRDAGPVARALPAEVPLINRVAAGYPQDFTDLGYPARIADEYVRVPDLSDPDAFAARVVGDSMEPQYRQGDVVVFSPARKVEDGCDCFARLEPDHETTFKRVYFESGPGGAELIRLQPINNRYSPKTLPREQVAGLYRAVSVTRVI